LEPNFVKIDTEGHELSVINGMKGLLQKGVIKYLSFEANGLAPADDLNEIFSILTSSGFWVGNIEWDNKVFYVKSGLGNKASSGDYQAISNKLRSELERNKFKFINV